MKKILGLFPRTVLLTLIVATAMAGCKVEGRLPFLRHSTAAPRMTPIQNRSTRELQEEAMLPELRSLLSELEDLTVYDIRVEIDFPAGEYSAEMIVKYRNQEDTALDRLYFRLYPNGGKSYGSGLIQVLNISAGGRIKDTMYSLEDSALEVIFNEPLEQGQAVELSIDFSGKVPTDFEGSGYGIYNKSQDMMVMANWFPILVVYDDEGWNLDPVSGIGDSVYSESSFFHVSIRVPNKTTLAATGTEISRNHGSDGWDEIQYVSGPVRDFILVLGPKLDVLSSDKQGIKIHSYYRPGHRKRARQALEIASRSVEIFNQKFGEYPFRELDVVDTPLNYAAGVEYPGLVLIKSSLYDDPTSDDTTFEIVTTHEVAHQWWYSVVGNDVIDEPWLDEALATYSSAVYYQVAEGQNSYQQIINNYRRSYRQAKNMGLDDPLTKGLGYFESTEARRQAYSPVVYNKGALFYHTLEKEIGEDAFFQALQSYYTAQRFGIGEPQEILSAFEDSASRELDDVYREWLYQPTAPRE